MSYHKTKGTWQKTGAGQSLGHQHTQGEQEVWEELTLPTAALRGWVPGVALLTHLACEEAAGRKTDAGTR